jgi:hypothetical protein
MFAEQAGAKKHLTRIKNVGSFAGAWITQLDTGKDEVYAKLNFETSEKPAAEHMQPKKEPITAKTEAPADLSPIRTEEKEKTGGQGPINTPPVPPVVQTSSKSDRSEVAALSEKASRDQTGFAEKKDSIPGATVKERSPSHRTGRWRDMTDGSLLEFGGWAAVAGYENDGTGKGMFPLTWKGEAAYFYENYGIRASYASYRNFHNELEISPAFLLWDYAYFRYGIDKRPGSLKDPRDEKYNNLAETLSYINSRFSFSVFPVVSISMPYPGANRVLPANTYITSPLHHYEVKYGMGFDLYFSHKVLYPHLSFHLQPNVYYSDNNFEGAITADIGFSIEDVNLSLGYYKTTYNYRLQEPAMGRTVLCLAWALDL